MNKFDGSLENLKKSFRFIWGYKSKWLYFAIDAAFLKGRILVHQNGIIEGLKNLKNIPTEVVNEINSSSENFAQFVFGHVHNTIKACFVIRACSPTKKFKSFPVALIPYSHGSSDIIIKNFFLESLKI